MAKTSGFESQVHQRAIAVGALILLGAVAVFYEGQPWLRAAAVVGALSVAGFGFRHPGPGSGVAVLAAAIAFFSAPGVLWQIAMPLALGVLAMASRIEVRLRGDRLQGGRVPIWATIFCAAVTPFALVTWVLVSAPDMRDITDAIPDVPGVVLLVGAVSFAFLNAVFEEWIWRGVIQPRLGALLPAAAAVVLQAASFGVAHAHGFPRGVAGVGLAGIWGAMLGVLRERSGGLLAPIAAHVVADATIATIVLLWLRP